ncbi:MAG: PAS domain S-box protein [Sedimentisphaerales bacterium]|nr:PAS domain S-box protein [Sedimentisphaerales bacterium]
MELHQDTTGESHMQESSSFSKPVFAADVYYHLFQFISEAAIVADARTGIILECNAAAELLTGQKRAELIGKHHAGLYAEETYNRYQAIYDAHVREGGGYTQEGAIRHPSGRLIPILMEARRVVIDQVDVIVGIFTELSKVRDLREKLEYSEIRYHHTINALMDIIHVIDRNYRITLSNKTAEDYQLRLKLPTPLVGKELWKACPFLNTHVREEYEQVFNTGQTLITKESQVIDNATFFTQTHKIPLLKDNQVTHVVTVIRDITQQMQTDLAIKDRQAMLDSIYRSAPTAIGVVSNRIIKWGNKKLYEMTGFSPDELCRQNARMLYPTEDEYQRVGKIKYDAIREKGTGAIETQWRCKDGRIIDVWLNSTPIDPEDLSVGVTFSALDITDHKKAERNLRESEERFRLLAENLPGVVYLCRNDDALTMVFLSDAISELTGYTPQDFYQKKISYSELCHWDDRERIRHDVNEATRQRKPFHLIYRLSGPDGAWRWVEEYGMGVFRDDRPVMLEGYINDIHSRMETEQSLQQSEAKLRSLYESVQAGVMVLNADGHVTHINQVACRIFGVEAQGICGKTPLADNFSMVDEYFRPIPPDQYPSIITLRTSQPMRNVVRGVKLKNSDQTCWLLINTEPVFEHITHKIREVIVTFSDITRRKQAEEAIRHERDRAQHYLDIAGVIIVALDAQGCITLINRRGCRILERSQEQLVGKSWFDVCVPEAQSGDVKKVFERLMAEEVKPAEYYENDICTPSGLKRTIAWHNNLLRDEAGAIIGTLSSGEDITERLAIEEKLRVSEREKTTILDSMAELVTFQDTDYKIKWANRAAVEASNIPPDKLVGQQCHHVWQGKNQPCAGCPVKKTFKTHQCEEAEITTPNGRVWLIKSVPVTNQDDKLIGVVETSLEITERKSNESRLLHYQEQLRNLASELTLAEETQRQRVATELHDHIGQNLALSILKLESIREDMPSGLAQELGDTCELIRQAVRDTRNLIFDLGSPTLYTSGFEEAVDDWLAEQLQGTYHIAYQFTDDNQPKPLEEQDKILLFRAVREVFINIIKHAQAHEVEVDIRRVDDKIQITIQDDGVGFDADKVLSGGGPGGQGFGLFSLRERLDHMGGRFDVASSPGQGTRVVLMAPLSRGQEQKESVK